jgi:hypothetical protein
MTAKIISLVKSPTPDVSDKTDEHIHKDWCGGCSETKDKVKARVRFLHRDYSKEFTSYYLNRINEKWFKLTFELTHLLLYIEKILDDICKSTDNWLFLMSNQCPNKVLNQYWDKVAGDYFLVRYLKSWNSMKQCLDFSKGCYMTWYDENKLHNMIWHILYNHLEEFLSIAPNFVKDLDFDISF